MSSRLHNMLPFRRLCLGLALVGSARVASALTQSYCSSENTGSDFDPVFSIYQSNGACQTTCQAEYAFAIVQFQNCWCSNYIPASQEDVNNCSQNCPGYPQELCGDESSGLFGYVALNVQPSGTAGAGSADSTSSPSRAQSSTIAPSTSSTTREPDTSFVSSTVVQTVTQSISQIIQTTQTTQVVQTSEQPTSRPPSSTRRPQSTETPTPLTSLIQTTVSGEVVTRTVTTTPTLIANTGQNGTVAVAEKDGLSGGAIAGIVIGVFLGLAVLAVAAFLLWRRKKNAEASEAAGGASNSKNMTRNVSVLSKAGLLSRGAQPSMGETDDNIVGGSSMRHSIMFGPGAEGVSPTSPLGSSHGESSSSRSRRTSKPMVYDQRLNPSALFSNSEANGSRISMQDTQDYSRPLGIANPDPRPSFESRKSNYQA